MMQENGYDTDCKLHLFQTLGRKINDICSKKPQNIYGQLQQTVQLSDQTAWMYMLILSYTVCIHPYALIRAVRHISINDRHHPDHLHRLLTMVFFDTNHITQKSSFLPYTGPCSSRSGCVSMQSDQRMYCMLISSLYRTVQLLFRLRGY